VGELVRILSAGVNVVATAAFITGHNLGAGRERIQTSVHRAVETTRDLGLSATSVPWCVIISGEI
jgi:4-hydroxy-tetrahydrodipicolinate reductase